MLGLQLLQESISQVRWLISGLRPVVLDDQGLVAAIDKRVGDSENRWRFPSTGRTRSNSTDCPRRWNRRSSALFRGPPQCLALSHRRGWRGNRLDPDRQDGRCPDQDWGSGFDPTVPKFNHFGLEGKRERRAIFRRYRADPKRAGKRDLRDRRIPACGERTRSGSQNRNHNSDGSVRSVRSRDRY